MVPAKDHERQLPETPQRSVVALERTTLRLIAVIPHHVARPFYFRPFFFAFTGATLAFTGGALVAFAGAFFAAFLTACFTSRFAARFAWRR